MVVLSLPQKIFFTAVLSLPVGLGLWLWSVYGVEVLLTEAARFCF